MSYINSSELYIYKGYPVTYKLHINMCCVILKITIYNKNLN